MFTSTSGQQRVKRSATDTESGLQTGDPLEMGTGVIQNTSREHRQRTLYEELL